MKKRILCALMAACLLLTGCSSLLERSYSAVEPYTNRYWDPGAEDTLKAESKQDLVNTLLMLVEQRAEEGEIRYYTEENVEQIAREAKQEVCEETVPGSYLLRRMSFTSEEGEGYCTLTYTMVYREDAEALETLMSLSDSESLADLLRLAIREEHEKMTARFVYETEHREDITAVVEGLWQELCLSWLAENAPPEPPATTEPTEETVPAEDGETTAEGEQLPEASAPSEEAPVEEPPASESADPAQPPEEAPEGEVPPEETVEEPAEPEIVLPSCPWEIRFYPDVTYAGVVEILLNALPEDVMDVPTDSMEEEI